MTFLPSFLLFEKSYRSLTIHWIHARWSSKQKSKASEGWKRRGRRRRRRETRNKEGVEGQQAEGLFELLWASLSSLPSFFGSPAIPARKRIQHGSKKTERGRRLVEIQREKKTKRDELN